RPIFDTRASPNRPFGRSHILGLKDYKAAVGDLNQSANNCPSRQSALWQAILPHGVQQCVNYNH
ncbi:MAG: hypothetical protein KGZ88_19945, partial [Methylomicrobium sp.]|nr:hypothetical protein [Methylomicrobium sp.]